MAISGNDSPSKSSRSVPSRIWHNAYGPGIPITCDYENINMSQALERTAREFPEHIALIFLGKKIKYRELDDLVNRFAKVLNGFGLRKGDKVAFLLPNIPQLVIAYYAVLRLGGVTVMNNPLYTDRELEYQLADSDSVMLITLDLLVPRMLTLKAKTKLKPKPKLKLRQIIYCHISDYLPFMLKLLFPVVKKSLYKKIRPDPANDLHYFIDLMKKAEPLGENARPQIDFDDLACIQYTGGTTGVSKGVMLTHGNISTNVQQLRIWFPEYKKGKESTLGALPFFHAFGLQAEMNICVYYAWTDILIPKPDAGTILKMVHKYKPTFLPSVPTMFIGILNHKDLEKFDLRSIKSCFSAAAPLAVETIIEFEKITGANIIEAYGLTEASSGTHLNPGLKTKIGSVGIPLPDMDCRIVDLETGEQDVAIGEPGEIILKGPSVMKGYYKKPDETAATLKDGWLCTGDIGKMDEEGYFYIVDRKKDMIIASGFNVYPREVDEILYEHPKVKEACAIGVPDPYRGETIKAYIVVKEGQKLTEEEIIHHCKKNLAPYKVPRLIEFAEDLPKSAIGKILRKELRRMELEKIEA